MKTSLPKLALSLALCFTAAFTGSLFTPEKGSAWYYVQLDKPSWNPPDWLFPPVWSLLFLMMAIAFWMVLKAGVEKNEVRTAIAFFALQLFLNMSWSAAFFGLETPLLGLVVIVLLWLAIVATIMQFRKISAVSAYLLVPYLLWVSFASFLNFTIWQLNP
ncbi:MAG: tryptophan-rich sensory protein [Chlorobi bacterium]|nr:tryptophan-rich sensory protein [Chlorobiota bacterium]